MNGKKVIFLLVIPKLNLYSNMRSLLKQINPKTPSSLKADLNSELQVKAGCKSRHPGISAVPSPCHMLMLATQLYDERGHGDMLGHRPDGSKAPLLKLNFKVIFNSVCLTCLLAS